MSSPTDTDFVDVLIVGAGLSGIGSARHLQRACPERSFDPSGTRCLKFASESYPCNPHCYRHR